MTNDTNPNNNNYNLLSLEYKDISDNMRYYANIRFLLLPIFLAVTGFCIKLLFDNSNNIQNIYLTAFWINDVNSIFSHGFTIYTLLVYS